MELVEDSGRLRSVTTHKTLRELAFEELRRAFFEGRFAPGEAVTISELSRQLEVGLMPTREAVQQLASMGAFEFLPNRSVRVPVHSMEEVEQLYQARLLNECHAASVAAERCGTEDKKLLHRNLELLREGLEKQDFYSIQTLNAQFHFSIYRLCGNPFVLDTIERLWLRIGPLHIAMWRDEPSARIGIGEVLPLHRELVDNLCAGDAEGAEARIRKMLQLSREWIRSHRDVLS